MGEGGSVLTQSGVLKKIVESFRDWGRDCWCAPGADNTCGRRFDWQLGDLPYGYDHKYVYSHVGYNLKLTDMQAAVGLAQLNKLSGFVAQRRSNWMFLRERLNHTSDLFYLPQETPRAASSWFGFPITIRPEAGFQRRELIMHLEQRGIGTRLLFGGNIVRQPAYKKTAFRIVEKLANADLIADSTFWIGVYPALGHASLSYVVESIEDFLKQSIER